MSDFCRGRTTTTSTTRDATSPGVPFRNGTRKKP